MVAAERPSTSSGCSGSAGADPAAPIALVTAHVGAQGRKRQPCPAAVCTEMDRERKPVSLLPDAENSPKRKEAMENGPTVHLGRSQAQFS